jgi:predicted RNA-binding protein with PUA domain
MIGPSGAATRESLAVTEPASMRTGATAAIRTVTEVTSNEGGVTDWANVACKEKQA